MSHFPIPRSDLLFDCIYDLERSEEEWIKALVCSLGPLIDGGHGAVAHVMEPREGESPILGLYNADDAIDSLEYYIMCLIDEGVDPGQFLEVFGRPFEGGPRGLESVAESMNQSKGYELYCRLFAGEGIVDSLGIIIPRQQKRTMFLVARQNQVRPVPIKVRRRWANLQKHITAVNDLRCRIEDDLWDEQTCLWFDEQGEYQSGREQVDVTIRQRLRAAIRLRDSALSRGKTADVASVEDFYTNVLNGQWALVDHFDSDGKRHVVAIPVAGDSEFLRAFTPRERQILDRLRRGESNKIIGSELGISTGAVASHLHKVYRKLGVQDRASAVNMATILWKTAPVEVSDD